MLDEDTDNNGSNKQDGDPKDAPQAHLPSLKPVTYRSLTNLNLTQVLALLQNSI